MKIAACLMCICVVTANRNNCGSIDLIFLVDESTSFGEHGFSLAHAFVDRVIAHVPISPSDVLVGFVTFSNVHRLHFRLKTHQNLSSLKTAMASVSPQLHSDGHQSDTAKAIHYVYNHLFKVSAGTRLAARKVLVVITNGESRDKSETASLVAKQRVHNIETYAVGLDVVDADGLHAISSDDEHVIQIGDHLTHAGISKFLNSLCNLTLPTHSTNNYTRTHTSTTRLHAQPTTTPRPTYTPWVVHPIPTENCRDIIDTCADYGPDTCYRLESWARFNCARFCVFCIVKTTTVVELKKKHYHYHKR